MTPTLRALRLLSESQPRLALGVLLETLEADASGEYLARRALSNLERSVRAELALRSDDEPPRPAA